jgi:hypothetical protein
MNAVQAAAHADLHKDNRERARFAQPGVMYPKMQAMLSHTPGDIGLANRRPPHPIGDTAVDPPYGIEGDAERMECIINAYLEDRTDKIQYFFHQCDTDNDGKLSYIEFTLGMKKFDKDTPKSAIEELIQTLDADGKGYITVNDIRTNFGFEFMKSKSQRASAGQTNILGWPLSQKDHPSKEDLMTMIRRRNKNSPRYAPHNTRAEKLRLLSIKQQLAETDPNRAAKMSMQSNLKENKILRSELKMTGVVPMMPAPPSTRKTPMSSTQPPQRQHTSTQHLVHAIASTQ